MDVGAVQPGDLGTRTGNADRHYLSAFPADSRRRLAVLLSPRRLRQRRPDNGRLRSRDRHLEIAAAAACQWDDWQIVHVEPGPFVNEMLGDPYRWRADGVLSVLVQAMPAQPHDSTPLRIVSFSVQPR